MTEETFEVEPEITIKSIFNLSIKQMPVTAATPDIAYNSGDPNLNPIKKVSTTTPKITWIESTTTVTPAVVAQNQSAIQYRLLWSNSPGGSLVQAVATVSLAALMPTQFRSRFKIITPNNNGELDL